MEDMDSVKLVVQEKLSQFLIICLFSVCRRVGGRGSVRRPVGGLQGSPAVTKGQTAF